MIFIEHFNEKTTTGPDKGARVILTILKCARLHPDEELIIYKKGVDTTQFLKGIKHYKGRTHLISNSNIFNDDLGYIDDKPFMNINTEVVYPTWIKGTELVYIHASLVCQIDGKVATNNSFLYWINSVGKLAQPLGVLSYQMPLNKNTETLSTKDLYQFVGQHYKKRWIFLLLLNHLLYEKRFPLVAFVKSLSYKKIDIEINFEDLGEETVFLDREPLAYDVVIPTMGRPDFIYDVLRDLNSQEYLPANVIIIEQNPDINSTTELDHILNTSWQFKIIHQFTHKTGACNARNEALALRVSSWVLFFDDDVRIETDFIKRANDFVALSITKCVTFSCLQKGEVEQERRKTQWSTFGSGCSLVHTSIIDACAFDVALEHGYGEDADYGMQIRNLGYDVLYAPDIKMLHLKAPVGGFRKPHVFPWKTDAIQPKPSPQIMYHRLKNTTEKQLKGYRLVLFIKFYRQYSIKNPITYLSYFNKAWKSSLFWAKKLPLND